MRMMMMMMTFYSSLSFFYSRNFLSERKLVGTFYSKIGLKYKFSLSSHQFWSSWHLKKEHKCIQIRQREIITRAEGTNRNSWLINFTLWKKNRTISFRYIKSEPHERRALKGEWRREKTNATAFQAHRYNCYNPGPRILRTKRMNQNDFVLAARCKEHLHARFDTIHSQLIFRITV